MRARAIITFNDRISGEKIKKGTLIEVKDENRLKELLGANKDNIVAVELIEKEPEKNTENDATTLETENKKTQKKDTKNAKRK
jgi:hypothetical protein